MTESSLIQAYMPSGKPCPVVLTGSEVAELLRLDGNSPERTLKFYRSEKGLVGFRMGRRIRYRLVDILSFLEQKSRSE